MDRSLRIKGYGRGGLRFENFSPLIEGVGLVLRLTGLYGRAQRNALALTVHERSVSICDLPPAFNGMRLLHLSDLHLDGYPGFGGRIAVALRGQRFDLAVLTGDFHLYDAGRYKPITAELAALVPSLTCRYWAYGRHPWQSRFYRDGAADRACRSSPTAERSRRVGGRGGAALAGGSGRPALLRPARLRQGAGCRPPPSEPRLLLAHSPEVIPEAAGQGFCLYLAGHTHGGQMCLPGGFAPYVNVRCARDQIVGPWRQGRMEGYTSAGVGSSVVFGRFFCPPEIVIHRLMVNS